MVRTFVSSAISAETSKYEDAVKMLNTLQSNAETLEKIRKEKDREAHLNIPKMEKYAARAGIQLSDMDKLNIIHVSGTKGKGSTCAFCESILRHHGYKTGFFSSPHLVEVRERFCVNGQPLEREKFTSYFWDVYNQLQHTKGNDIENNMPSYFAFLVVMAFHVFKQEKVDVAIMEVGIGGQYDSTNVIRNPLVCGVTSLGIDHVSVLGKTIDKIAWHKSGIFKPNVPAFTSPQVPEAMSVLKSRAEEIGCTLSVSPEIKHYGSEFNLGIKGRVQEVNASLGLQLCNTWMKKYKEKSRKSEKDEDIKHINNGDLSSNNTVISEKLPNVCDIPVAQSFHLTKQHYLGLEQCQWLGRSQKLEESGCTFYLDGAHTVESIEECVDWFSNESSKDAIKFGGEVYRVLIFNTTGDRNTASLLTPLINCHFDAVLFCPNIAYVDNISFDQTNNTVTKEMQINRCVRNKKTWVSLCTKPEAELTVNGEHLKDAATQNGGTNKHEENGLDDTDICNTSSDKSLLTFPSISHCINWVRQRQWEHGVKIKGKDCKSDSNGIGDGENILVDCDIGDIGTNSNVCSSGVGDSEANIGAANGVSGNNKKHVQVLITGSLHLVGGSLRVLWDNQH
ncbi:hypothetical protein ACF0H5_021686 [Mactra antiquata]